MDKFEYKYKADEIKELIALGDYKSAVKIADTIDWNRVKSVMMLCTISDLYKINRRYEESRDILLLAYDRHPGGRTIIYSLCELSIKLEDYVQAVEYYKEFVHLSPKDTGRYILQYKLYVAQDVGLEERIEVLKELKKKDYREKWAYELAYLYHRIGLATKCIEECDELILWFGDGKYVNKAMELKMLHQPLTYEQQMKYNERFESQQNNKTIKKSKSEKEQLQEQEVPILEAPTVKIPSDEIEIQVKTMDVGEYNTINLQKEIAEGLKEVLQAQPKEASSAEQNFAPMFESDTESLDLPQKEDILVAEEEGDMIEPVVNETSHEVFFGETGEIVTEEQGLELESVLEYTAEQVMEQIRKEIKEPIEPPKALANVLAMESDGQIALVVPDAEQVEKQITGQISIEDIFVEWERMKRENEEQRKESVRKKVLEQTGAMFTEFEASIRDGILGELEAEMREDTQKAEEELQEVEEEMQETSEELQEVEEEMQETSEELQEVEEEMQETSEELQKVEEEMQETSEELQEVEELQEASEKNEKIRAQNAKNKQKVSNVRELSREELELFASFIQKKATKQELAQVLDTISLASYTGNVIITGEEGIDTLTLAKNMVRHIHQTDDNFSGRSAKISGGALNSKNVEDVLSGLENGALIIHKASTMNSDTVKDLNKYLQKDNRGIVIILEDEKKPMMRFLSKNEILEECFNARINIDALSNDMLAEFGKKYARDRDYSFDELANLALHTRIEELQTSDHAATIMDVKEIMDEAIYNANKKNIGHFFDVLFGKRYDEEDMIILRENDFI